MCFTIRNVLRVSFHFFVVVMVYKITESTESLLLCEIKSDVSGNLWSYFCLNRAIDILFYVCFCFKTFYLMYILIH